ncbi:MAG: hypothetical protein QW348_06700 [Ignisphaera sp.]
MKPPNRFRMFALDKKAKRNRAKKITITALDMWERVGITFL